jgi:alpha-beta hydrolase superfamily lysophospholipase
MTDSILKRSGQPALRLRRYPTPPSALGAVLVTTGFSEHVDRYEHVCARWQAAGFLVASWDLRGQGHSQGAPGFVSRFSDFTDDLFAVLEHLHADPAWRDLGPPVVFAHSMGALICLHAALQRPERFRGLALASPYLGLALNPPAWQLWAGRKLAQIWPKFSQPTGLRGNMVTHDAQRAAQIEADPLSVRRMTAALFTQTETAQAQLLQRAAEFRVPIFCRAAGTDLIADVAITEEFFRRCGSSEKALVVVPGEYHELHNELDWQVQMDAFANQFRAWYRQRAVAE